ncbi:MAG: thioredoxin family protein [Labilithrix sp.]|nr:thioredoxin family protein [Labilithrix sp.]MCW5815828.1 thioredoxin family protein [Labilithrix sp.]
MAPLRIVVLLTLLAGCGKQRVAPQIPWEPLDAGEVHARESGKPALVFVCAEWSVACRKLDDQAFTHPAVRAASQRFVTVRVDATDDEDPATAAARRRFDLVGLPTLLALDSLDGARGDLERIHTFVEPAELAARLDAAADRHDEALAAVRARMKAAKPRDDAPAWETDLAAARRDARAANKPLLVVSAHTWTEESMRMEGSTLAHPLVREVLERSFVVVRLEVDQPALAVEDAHGGERQRFPSGIAVETLVPALEQHARERVR